MIEDLRGYIPLDEPVFLLRAQDCFAADIVEQWATKIINAHGDPMIAASAQAQATRMRNWQVKKMPDLPEAVPEGAAPVAGIEEGVKAIEAAEASADIEDAATAADAISAQPLPSVATTPQRGRGYPEANEPAPEVEPDAEPEPDSADEPDLESVLAGGSNAATSATNPNPSEETSDADPKAD
jgi:hypothetical protein